jgi:hypothetical protein
MLVSLRDSLTANLAITRERLSLVITQLELRAKLDAKAPATVTPGIEPAKPKRKLSVAGRKAIVAALKKRHAAKQTTPAVAETPKRKFSAAARKHMAEAQQARHAAARKTNGKTNGKVAHAGA